MYMSLLLAVLGSTYMWVDFDAELTGVRQLPLGSSADAAGVLHNGLKHRERRGRRTVVCHPIPSAILLRDAPTSLFHQRHLGRLL